jgi:hypothetical protein
LKYGIRGERRESEEKKGEEKNEEARRATTGPDQIAGRTMAGRNTYDSFD